MSLRFSLRLAALGWFCAAFAGLAAAPRPNILFIMTDDHAAHAISAYGSKVNQTPHLDRLGAQGLRLNRCYAVNSICTPSRATILTGQYSHRNGVPTFNHLDPAKVTVAHRLREAGYYTAMLASGTSVLIRRGSTIGTSCPAKAAITTRSSTTVTGTGYTKATPPRSSPTSRSTC